MINIILRLSGTLISQRQRQDSGPHTLKLTVDVDHTTIVNIFLQIWLASHELVQGDKEVRHNLTLLTTLFLTSVWEVCGWDYIILCTSIGRWSWLGVGGTRYNCALSTCQKFWTTHPLFIEPHPFWALTMLLARVSCIWLYQWRNEQ